MKPEPLYFHYIGTGYRVFKIDFGVRPGGSPKPNLNLNLTLSWDLLWVDFVNLVYVISMKVPLSNLLNYFMKHGR